MTQKPKHKFRYLLVSPSGTLQEFRWRSQAFDVGEKIGEGTEVMDTQAQFGESEVWIYEASQWKVHGICGFFDERMQGLEIDWAE